MTRIPDPAALLSEDDRKDAKKVKDARAKGKGWKLPTTKAARKAEQDERIAQWLAENGQVAEW